MAANLSSSWTGGLPGSGSAGNGHHVITSGNSCSPGVWAPTTPLDFSLCWCTGSPEAESELDFVCFGRRLGKPGLPLQDLFHEFSLGSAGTDAGSQVG